MVLIAWMHYDLPVAHLIDVLHRMYTCTVYLFVYKLLIISPCGPHTFFLKENFIPRLVHCELSGKVGVII